MVKRAPGTGSIIYEKKRKLWIYQFTIKENGKSKRKAIYAKSREDLERRIAKINTHVDFNITVGSWMIKWLSVYVKDVVREKTAIFYKQMLHYITDDVKKTKLSELTTLQCQMMLSELRESGSKSGGMLSTSTVRSIRSVFITCLDAAIENSILKSNPMKKTKPPRLIRKEKVFLSPAQAARLREVAEKGDYYIDKVSADPGQLYLLKCYGVMIHLALVTGMRRGELFGLQWQYVDFEKNTLTIKYQETKADKGFRLSITKTISSIRTISIDNETMKKLKDWQTYQKIYAEMLGVGIWHTNPSLVFTNVFGSFIDPDNFRLRHWHAMCKAADLPDGTTLHSLRHTAATFMLSSGIDVKTAAARLGHANANTLLKVYAHVLDRNDSKAADTLANLISTKKVSDDE